MEKIQSALFLGVRLTLSTYGENATGLKWITKNHQKSSGLSNEM